MSAKQHIYGVILNVCVISSDLTLNFRIAINMYTVKCYYMRHDHLTDSDLREYFQSTDAYPNTKK